jgi:hypothetical protein
MDAGQSDRISNKCQLWHLAGAFLRVGWKSDNPIKIKEANVRWIFDELGLHFQSVLGSRERHVL